MMLSLAFLDPAVTRAAANGGVGIDPVYAVVEPVSSVRLDTLSGR